MMTLSKDTLAGLDRIGAKAVFFMNPEGSWTCVLTDITTNTPYVTGTHVDRDSACVTACENAKTAPKPLTKAQKDGLNYAEGITQNLQAENERLKAELAAAREASSPKALRAPKAPKPALSTN